MSVELIAAIIAAAAAFVAAVLSVCSNIKVARLSANASTKQDLARYHREVVMGPHFQRMFELADQISDYIGTVHLAAYWEFGHIMARVERLAQHFAAVDRGRQPQPGAQIAEGLRKMAKKMQEFEPRLVALGKQWKQIPKEQKPDYKPVWLQEQQADDVLNADRAFWKILRIAEVNISYLRAWAAGSEPAPDLREFGEALAEMDRVEPGPPVSEIA